MDTQDLRTLKLLEEIESNQLPSQRYLARQLNISLGLANAFIKRLAKKGYFKITSIPKNKVKYILTPKGVAEKTRLTYEYIQYSFQFYKKVRANLQALFTKLIEKDMNRIVFYGANEVAEIAYISLQETNIELVAVADDNKAGKRFISFIVTDLTRLSLLTFDAVFITEMNDNDDIIDKLLASGIPKEKVILLE